MINWDEVKVGETELVSELALEGRKTRVRVVGLWENSVWIHSVERGFDTWDRGCFRDWTIDDPWREVSEECTINSAFDVIHNGRLLTLSDEVNGQYKRGPGLRVWIKGKP